ncbi:Transmembrane emp24 domain-containing protein bai [Galdieria sulphuraria]|nr:Transmembrane emp24 domain-containing protein bai [Galdieria sulphuraria]
MSRGTFGMWWSLLLYLLVISNLFEYCHSIQFYMNAGTKRCFSEEITSNTKVFGECLVVGAEGSMSVDLLIRGPQGEIIVQQKNIDKQSFGFTTPQHVVSEETGFATNDIHWPPASYHFCFETTPLRPPSGSPPPKRKIILNVQTDFVSSGFTDIAKVQHLNSLEAALRRMEEQFGQIVVELENCFVHNYDDSCGCLSCILFA